MINYAVLGSGSSANSYIIQHEGISETPGERMTFIVDNGFSCREFSARAQKTGFNPADIKFIFLTHDHSDHLKGVSVLSGKYSIPVVMSSGITLKREYAEKIYKILVVEKGKDYCYSNLKFSVFETSHDSEGSVSYSFEIDGVVFTIITDTGVVTEEMEKHAIRSDVLFLEANYCPEMLENGPYPWFLKKRIASEHGHLSNDAAVEFIKKIDNSQAGVKKRMTYFCHLSDKNNCSDKLESIVRKSLPEDFNYRICRKGETVAGTPIKTRDGGRYE